MAEEGMYCDLITFYRGYTQGTVLGLITVLLRVWYREIN